MTGAPRLRLILLAAAALALLAALWGGLLRLGWRLPVPVGGLAALHGPLMIAGFLGALISLERAVALGRRWAYAVPALTSLGALALVVGVPGWAGPALIALGSLGLVAIFAEIVRQHPALYTATMAAGALAWLAGNLLWLAGRPVYGVTLWWGGFLVLTIAGERLELGRLRNLPASARRLFVAAALGLALGLITSAFAADAGARLAGGAQIALALWLLRYDIARRTVRRAGLTRFIAVCMLSGYIWLGVAGALAIAFGGVPAGPRYDALLHALFVGFVFAMIFGHAPIIFPAVLGVPVAYSPAFYAPLALLHLSLALRLAGDLAGLGEPRRWGGLLNAAAVLLFLASVAWSILRSTSSDRIGEVVSRQ